MLLPLFFAFELLLVGFPVKAKGLPHANISPKDRSPEPEAEAEALPGFNGRYNSKYEGKIFNGIISQSRYSFYVAIMKSTGDGKWQLVCGGSLIDPYSVLSAGHCTIVFNSRSNNTGVNVKWEAWLNPYELRQQPKQRIPIVTATTSPNYDDQNIYNDIGMYTLSRPAILNQEVSTICIGNYSNYNGIDVELVGFGTTGCKKMSRTSDILLYAKGTTVSAENCSSTNDDLQNRGDQVCANLVTPSYAEQGSGDSGGPLFGQENGKFTQIGIVSHNFAYERTGCPLMEYPGIYTIPVKHMDFIKGLAPGAATC